jgi:murein L,D-transpeptidase YafK
VDSFYGPLAFVTSYPNTYDKIQGKNGSGIWVHGLPLHQERDDYTKGCIAINNSNIEDIEDKIDFKKTIVYIDKENYPEIKKKNLANILSQLFSWRESWKYSDTEAYLDFYDENFKHQGGMGLKEFQAYKRRVFSKNESKQIIFSNINVIPYPMQDDKDLFLISFHEEYRSPSYQFSGEKELYIHLDNNNLTILAEK